MHEVNIFQNLELTSDELAVVRGGQLVNYAYSPSQTGGPLGVGPGIGPGFISGGINAGLFSVGQCQACGTAPVVFTVGGLNAGPFTSAENNSNANTVGGTVFRNNFLTILN
jgi:hypothetical protein